MTVWSMNWSKSKRSTTPQVDGEARDQPEASQEAVVPAVSDAETPMEVPLAPKDPSTPNIKMPLFVRRPTSPKRNRYIRPASPASTPQRAFFNRHGYKKPLSVETKPREEMFVEVGRDIAAE